MRTKQDGNMRDDKMVQRESYTSRGKTSKLITMEIYLSLTWRLKLKKGADIIKPECQ